MPPARLDRSAAAKEETNDAAPAGRPADDGEADKKVSPGERYRPPARLLGAQQSLAKRKSIFILCGLTLLQLGLIFPRVGWWPVAYVCLVPWLVGVCTARRAPLMYVASYLLGVGFFAIHIRWMIPVTLAGYIAMCLYYAAVFPLAAWPIRHMHRRHRVSVALTAPLVWTAFEYLRSIGPLGFPWVLLGHSQYEVLPMIQISDLVGAYGVSFVVAMLNGWVTDLLIQPILLWRGDEITRVPVGSMGTAVVLVSTLFYGIRQSGTGSFEPGLRVAVIQPDFPMYVDRTKSGRTPVHSVLETHLELTRQALAEKPDLVVLPETAMQGFINESFLNATPVELGEILRRRYPRNWTVQDLKNYQDFGTRTRDAFCRLSRESGVAIVIGSSSIEWLPTAVPPRVDAFNSAFLITPESDRPVARYDKVHLVLFGEYVPFRFSYRALYDWLNSITPWGREGIEYSLSPGADFRVFEFEAAASPPPRPGETAARRRLRAGTPICYEEIMPYVTRELVRPRGHGPASRRKNIDLLLSISNDGWFLHSAELEQHLSAAVFRAVEHRIPVVRSVNTGTSALVRPNGEIHDRVAMRPEKLERLEGASGVLREMQRIAGLAREQVRDDRSYLASWTKLNQLLNRELAGPLDQAGRELKYIQDRLALLLSQMPARRPEYRLEAVAVVQDQIADDLAMFDRWREKPWTAPGYGIGEVKLDSRITLYCRWGDWFAQGTVALVLMIVLDWLLRRLWPRPVVAAGGVAHEQ